MSTQHPTNPGNDWSLEYRPAGSPMGWAIMSLHADYASAMRSLRYIAANPHLRDAKPEHYRIVWELPFTTSAHHVRIIVSNPLSR